jgi:protein gp37
MLNKSKGNMFHFVTHTFNPISFNCWKDGFACDYCYMKTMAQRFQVLDREKCLAEKLPNLGTDRVIFPGSSTDIFHPAIPDQWLETVLNHCRKFPNRYWFQTKNPGRMKDFSFPEYTTLAVTIESNRPYLGSRAEEPIRRAAEFAWVHAVRKAINIEPVMDFDTEDFLLLIRNTGSKTVIIGAGTKTQHPEPDPGKLTEFIAKLETRFEVIRKPNLKRIIGA